MIKAPYNPIDVANYIVAEAVKRKARYSLKTTKTVVLCGGEVFANPQ